MILEFLTIGIFIGILSGFFGIGGGMILIPILLLFGIDIKEAITISILQMAFSSIYGSYLNYKKGSLIIGNGLFLGFGGFFGGYAGGYLTGYLSDEFLEFTFIGLLLLAIFRIYFSKSYEGNPSKEISNVLLFIIGIFIGMISIMLGIGGAILLVPLLLGFLHYPTNRAFSAGLFFVMFSSFAGLLSKLSIGGFDLSNGFIVAISSLLGVYFGIWLREKIDSKHHKKGLLFLYIFTLLILIKKIWF